MAKQDFLFSDEQNIQEQLQSALLKIEKDDAKIKLYEEEINRLHEIIAGLQRNQFGKKSERWESDEQLCFNEAEVESKKPEPSEYLETEIKVEEHTKKRGHRKSLPTNLEREVVVIELPKGEQVGKDGSPLKVIGYEISEKLSYEPAKTKVIEYRRAKYGADSGDYEKTAPPVPSIIPKGIATPELVASIIVKKYAYGMPLYRQEEMFAELGVEIPRQTMARWVVQHAEACRSIFNVLNDRFLASSYVACDETHTQVLKEKGKTAESQSWMWVRCTPSGKNRIVLFDYDPHRSADVAKKLLSDVKGYLQVDGFGSYNILEKNEGLIRIGCNMHARRYFEQAHTEGKKSGKTLPEVVLKFYQKLYKLEEDYRSLPLEERHRKRLEEHLPLWDEIKPWAEKQSKIVPPRSKIGKAFNYFLSEYDYITGYLKDGRLEMDNGFCERAIRKFAIGRNNWLFSDTEAGAEASAMFYSFLGTAKINGVDLYKVMTHLFREIPKAQTLEDIERLADIIVAAQPLP